MEKPLEHLRRARQLLEMGARLGDETAIILYAAAIEAIVAAVLSASSARRSKRLCTASTKRLINMALVELSRARIIDGREAVRLRRLLQAVRCRRNRLLHPSIECIREQCESVNAEEARRAVEEFLGLAERLLGARA